MLRKKERNLLRVHPCNDFCFHFPGLGRGRGELMPLKGKEDQKFRKT